MYNSGVGDEQVAKQQLHAQVQNAFQQQVVAYHGPHHLFLISARQLRLAAFDEVAFFGTSGRPPPADNLHDGTSVLQPPPAEICTRRLQNAAFRELCKRALLIGCTRSQFATCCDGSWNYIIS